MASTYKISPKLIKKFSEIKTNLTPLEARGVYCANALDPNDWRYRIIDFLKNSIQRTYQKFKYLALSFVLVGRNLFKKSIDGSLLQCLSMQDAYLSMTEVHESICGAHQADQKMH
ncbi:hypothetical protein AHAS_Ahas13G0346300 [Arachis hypogaea]